MSAAAAGSIPTMYGIRNCDTIRKARAWLDGRGIAYRFHDYRLDGLPPALLARCCSELGWAALLNRNGTTFRKLLEAEREPLDEARASALMLAHPALIRRPLLDLGGRLLVGFDAAAWGRGLAAASR